VWAGASRSTSFTRSCDHPSEIEQNRTRFWGTRRALSTTTADEFKRARIHLDAPPQLRARLRLGSVITLSRNDEEGEDMRELTEGTFLRWIDPEPGQKPLGVVLASPPNGHEDTIYVLMADHQGNTDLEVFVARPEATGFDASNLVQRSMEIVEGGDPELIALLRELGPNWWHITAHLEGEHEKREDPACLLCREGSESA
jgi:hypothetical protein